MTGFRIIGVDSHDERAEWDRYVQMLPYDLRDVHLSSGWWAAHHYPPAQTANLAVLESPNGAVTMQPFLLRYIDGRSTDMTAPGFGGLFQVAPLPDREAAEAFEAYMVGVRRGYGVVSEFYLLNPVFLEHQWMLLAVPPAPEREVYLAHLAPLETMLERVRKTRRQQMLRLRDKGDLDPAGPFAADEFAALYESAMVRKGASDRWRFDREHFARLDRNLGPLIRWYAVHSHGVLQAAAVHLLGTVCGYYYLAATIEGRRSGMADWALMRGLMSAQARGCEWFYLGGGRGGEIDTLATYKRSFGAVTRMLYGIRRVFDADAYARLSGPALGKTAFFPAYRAKEVT